MSTTTLKHPEIGEIKGKVGDGVHQFLGVQYGTLENRFSESKVKSSYSSPVDATSHGYVGLGPEVERAVTHVA